jgi:hypothetical protein
MARPPFDVGGPIGQVVDWLIKTFGAADTALDARLDVLESVRFDQVATQEARALTSYGALTTSGPTITVPANGNYIVVIGAYMRTNTVTATAVMSYDVGGSGAVDTDSVQEDTAVANLGGHRSRASLKTLTSGTVLVAKYKATAGTATFRDRWMQLIRVP